MLEGAGGRGKGLGFRVFCCFFFFLWGGGGGAEGRHPDGFLQGLLSKEACSNYLLLNSPWIATFTARCGGDVRGFQGECFTAGEAERGARASVLGFRF